VEFDQSLLSNVEELRGIAVDKNISALCIPHGRSEERQFPDFGGCKSLENLTLFECLQLHAQGLIDNVCTNRSQLAIGSMDI